jgi:hypothetical protein
LQNALAEERPRFPPFGDGLEEERESVVDALVGVISRHRFNTSRKDLGQGVREIKWSKKIGNWEMERKRGYRRNRLVGSAGLISVPAA